MAVKVTLNTSTNTLEFRPETPADNDVANYLCKLVRDAKAIVGNADPATVAKSRVGEIGLVAKAHQERIQALKGIIQKEEARSRQWELTYEIRQVASLRAHAAREELHALEEGR